MEELFSPETTIKDYVSRHGISVDDIGVAQKVVVSWGRSVIEQMAETIGAHRPDHWFYGDRQPMYRGLVGEVPVSLVELPVGAPGTIMIMEEMIAAGAETFIGLGWAGSLQPDLPIGAFIIPTSCISEEGTSRHYCETLPELPADPLLTDALEEKALQEGIKTRKGIQWTTDAPYRELRSVVQKYRELGVLGVDMETSAMYMLAKFRGVRVCNLLVVSDVLGEVWQPGFGSDNLKRANEVAQKIVLSSIVAG